MDIMIDASKDRLFSALNRLEMDIKNLSNADAGDKNLIQMLLKENTELKKKSEEIIDLKRQITDLIGRIHFLEKENASLMSKLESSQSSMVKNMNAHPVDAMLLDSSSSDDVEVSIKKLKKLVTKKS